MIVTTPYSNGVIEDSEVEDGEVKDGKSRVQLNNHFAHPASRMHLWPIPVAYRFSPVLGVQEKVSRLQYRAIGINQFSASGRTCVGWHPFWCLHAGGCGARTCIPDGANLSSTEKEARNSAFT